VRSSWRGFFLQVFEAIRDASFPMGSCRGGRFDHWFGCSEDSLALFTRRRDEAAYIADVRSLYSASEGAADLFANVHHS